MITTIGTASCANRLRNVLVARLLIAARFVGLNASSGFRGSSMTSAPVNVAGSM